MEVYGVPVTRVDENGEVKVHVECDGVYKTFGRYELLAIAYKMDKNGDSINAKRILEFAYMCFITEGDWVFNKLFEAIASKVGLIGPSLMEEQGGSLQ